MQGKLSIVENFWCLSEEEALLKLSCTKNGLSSEQATERQKQFGKNSLKTHRRTTSFKLFLSQFKSPITILLIIAACLSMGLGDATDALMILVIIVISSILGFWQESRASRAVELLLKIVQIQCTVLRDGRKTSLPVEDVVPGDVIFLSAGDVIAGDCLVLESHELFVDEAAFTGETFPAEKKAGLQVSNAPLSKRDNSLFMGSHVVSGIATALIMKTGAQTEFGRISKQLQLRPSETDFEKGIRKFGYFLMEITLILVIIIFAINVLLHKPVLDSILFALALAVGLTPQLLPAIITINLSNGARNMAKEKVIVKRLTAIENFGSMNILCSDKTGTITEGKIKINETLNIQGQHSDKVSRFVFINASLQTGFHNPIDEAICKDLGKQREDFKLQCEIPYDFIRKRLTVQVNNGLQNLAITKGALKSVLDVCSRAETETGTIVPIEDKKEEILKQYEVQSAKGYRVLGVCYKECNTTDFTRSDETEMTFLGFITLFDPLKDNIDQVLSDLKDMGVQLKIITGDNSLVAAKVASDIGIERPVILTGGQIRKMSDTALLQQVMQTHIFAEVEPNQKERIISFLKKNGNVVGFMGDGINDASALHSADVGISVDSAVDVAKEAADIVLLAHDLGVLSRGIIAGRKTFANTMKYIFMATSANFGNMFSMAGISLYLPFLPLLPKQILLTNLLTDLPEMTIATDTVDAAAIQLPHKWDLHYIQRFMITFGLLSSVFDYLTFFVLLSKLKANEKAIQTGWFLESVISASLIVLVVRTKSSFFKSIPSKYLFIATIFVVLSAFALPFTHVGTLFEFRPLPLMYYYLVTPLIIVYILCAEIIKRIFYKKMRKAIIKT